MIGNVYFAWAISKLFQLNKLRTIEYREKKKNKRNCWSEKKSHKKIQKIKKYLTQILQTKTISLGYSVIFWMQILQASEFFRSSKVHAKPSSERERSVSTTVYRQP